MNKQNNLGKREIVQGSDDFNDIFDKDLPKGRVIGKSGVNGVTRLGADIEHVIGIDHGALRIEPLVRAGWGRAGLAYGPYTRRNGLAMAVSILNGHNTSQTGPLRQSLKRRFYDWAYGSRAETLLTRCLQWIRFGRKKRTLRMWRRWWEISAEERNGGGNPLDENLAIGWFPNEVPLDPKKEGNAFVVHATGSLNGELWSAIATEMSPLIRGLQNIPLDYIIILREQGAAYYAASVPDVPYLPAYPRMRPLAIDPDQRDEIVYAGLFQSVLGQIGFRADTRVREFRVNHLSELDTWYGTAHIADRLTGGGRLSDQLTENYQDWIPLTGDFVRTKHGCRPISQDSMAVTAAEKPSGLIHLLVKTESRIPDLFCLVWRYSNLNNYYAWEFGDHFNQIRIYKNGESEIIHRDENTWLKPGTQHSLQILDNDSEIRLFLDGQLTFVYAVSEDQPSDSTGIGFACHGPQDGFYLNSIEAHPRELPIPEGLCARSQWVHPPKQKTIIRDDFLGEKTEDINGRKTPVGKGIWHKEIGKGKIEILGDRQAKVSGTIYQPNPGRTAYTIPWDIPDYADLELEFVPPSEGPLEYEKSRVGLIFLQDPDNYITVSTFVDDYYDGSSIAFFYNLNGFEEIYDAIWSNVGREISWGKPSRVRVILDKLNFAILVNGEAVCYRSLQDVYPDIKGFHLTKVGIVVNWEWGDDTGTILKEFLASDKG